MKKEVINIKGLEYTYPDGTIALSGIDLTVFEGESVGLIGPNGAGKTTLLLHLNGILQGKGQIKVLGLEINDSNLMFIRNRVGMVFQNPEDQLFMPTVFDNVAFGPINIGLEKCKVEDSVKKALKEVEMEESSGRYAHHLSFGEKKKIALATVLSMNLEILVLDEPSSNLDPGARRHLINSLTKLNLTKIVAGHDLEMILDTCNRVVLLNKGKIITNGEPKKILANKSLMETHGLEVPSSLL